MSIRIVPTDFFSIQEALDHADPGDEIRIKAGVYNENIVITTSNIHVVGEIGTILHGNHNKTGITIEADEISLQNLIIVRYDIGILLAGHKNFIKNCMIQDINQNGIEVKGDGNRITACIFRQIDLSATTIKGNGNLVDSSTYDANVITNIEIADAGEGNMLRNNCIVKGTIGIAVMDKGARGNVITGNRVSDVQIGITIVGHDTRIASNMLIDCSRNAILVTGNDNTVVGNLISDGAKGISIYDKGCSLLLNSISKMTDKAIEISGNQVLVEGNVLLQNNMDITMFGDEIQLRDNLITDEESNILRLENKYY